ncbi:hypothetical protein PTE30175_01848 [Pandoraea terrae]|uniref:Uncharacterized protein n=1 Tax=Pandoraea terrae TaxID=1537710 RepID=A0A5E4UBB5_9BURK|nr:hypothetical protein PTE30175_01848 [Pandoraea terrae]
MIWLCIAFRFIKAMGAAVSPQQYKGYTVWGFAKGLPDGHFDSSGSVSKDHLLIGASDDLGTYPTFESATQRGIDWAKAWVDRHGVAF